ncbi:hypothetical protein DSO57_1023525 [Entomophthora muscae]|uniref:Uncharacterized protein n=1 Tax=Entomophthora muscae TaxID=34485 RepID=A0ACC2UMZ8_9FUNG|nr:hypothetical protein DSO57_1023525 [Entomophthora muscae]
MLLPWFILDEIIRNVDYPLLLELRLLNRYANQSTKKLVFERFVFEENGFSALDLEFIFKYASLCLSISLPSCYSGNFFASNAMIPRVFSKFSRAHSLRVYLVNDLADQSLDLMCRSVPEIKHLSVYYVRKELRLISLASLACLTSLTICYATNSFRHYMLGDCAFPHLKRLVVVLIHDDLHHYKAELNGNFPQLAYLHTLGRMNGIDYSFFEVDIAKNKVLSVGKYSTKKKRLLSFRLSQGYQVDLLPLNSESLSASYRHVTSLLEEFLKSDCPPDSPLLVKDLFYSSYRWRIERNKPFKLPHVDAVTIDVLNLQEIRKPDSIYATTKIAARKFTTPNPNFIQWLVNFYPSLKYLDIHDSLDNLYWGGSFPSLETLKTKAGSLRVLVRFIDAAPRLQFIYSNISSQTARELIQRRPNLCICPYRCAGRKGRLFLSEYDNATFGHVDPCSL